MSGQPETANLQRLSIAAAARLMNVSERSAYMARELMRTNRTDLCQDVENGKLSLLAALRQAKPAKYDKPPDRISALLKAWHKCSVEERNAFLEMITSKCGTGVTHNHRPKGLCDVL